MSKRFTDTNKYKKPFFRGLQGPYKLLWDFLYHECDHAGIWIVDFAIAQIYVGNDMQIDRKKALEYFNKDQVRVIEIEQGNRWFILPFIEFQYGELNPQNRAHNSVISILKKHNLYNSDKGLISSLQEINKPLISPLQGAMDMDKDKDKDKEEKRGMGKKEEIPFETFWNLYDKKEDRKPCESKWKKLTLEDQQLIIEKLPAYIQSTPDKTFRKNPETYLNRRSWENEIVKPKQTKNNAKPSDPPRIPKDYNPYAFRNENALRTE